MRLLDEPWLPPLTLRARLRFDVVSRVLADLRPRSVLEIGCGQGAVGVRIASRTTYVGVEPDATAFEVARARVEPRGGSVVWGTDLDVEQGEAFDLVCAFEVLEHIDDDQSAMAAWVERVAPGGHLLISVPADQQRFGPMDQRVGHYRRYDEGGLTALAQRAGLRDIEITRYGWPLSYALEGVRNQLDKRLRYNVAERSPEELSAASGRTFQPLGSASGRVVELVVLPFRYLQRVRPRAGTGLVMLGSAD